MFFWFVSLSVLIVLVVFQSPAIDHRTVALGSVLPLVVPFVLHTLLGSVVMLGGVMVLGRGRRLVQRRWLGLPIGTFLHLVLDGTWTRSALFWWPFGGNVDGWMPELDRPIGVLVAAEVVGCSGLGWLVRRYGLADAARRRRFLQTGRLEG